MDSSLISSITQFEWNAKAIGLLDLDAFFASVEQLDHPEWRGKPVIVGGDSNKRGVLSTASYEARKFGVHSAMPSAQAQRRCPQAIWTRGNMNRYRDMSAHVMNIIKDETPYVEQVSIDEAFFDISPGRYSAEHPVAIAARIQKKVSELGITCSIGLGTSKSIAKIASEQEKPNGLTVVLPGSEGAFLDHLPIEALSGVGKSSAAVLHREGIHTLGQLAQADESEIKRMLGVRGIELQLRAHGIDSTPVRDVAHTAERKSISHERTFAQDLYDRTQIEAAIMYVSHIVGTRARKLNMKGSQVTLKVKYDNSHSASTSTGLLYPSFDDRTFGPVAVSLLDKIWDEGMPVRLIGVCLDHLGAPGAQQLSFTEEGATTEAIAQEEENLSLSKAMDSVRQKFGNDVVQYGRSRRFEESISHTKPTKDG